MDKKVIKRVGLGLVVYLVFAGLVLVFYPDDPDSMDWKDREQFNKVQIAKLQLGTGRQAVITQLGSPDISEAKQVEQSKYQVMFYRTQHMESDGITTMNECTPLLFENDSLVAWGEGAYQQYLSY
ncbi:DUF3192 domain-containing protein [Aliiglaciecola sp. CAU 1673]|uniref:DUF3192 domain-containing protein n=1 Tax=Aliiglaciecola sp. CAU 1673 TaxID=3032595 RepID=UPI0023DB138B|nr:DUF3192 domain-containing protein [Aliiglaciecola sp. CAU 1673]MDF2179643.1 DUF3192 domain-containing protein [Aliiglaciecola sp. CAU 1673]